MAGFTIRRATPDDADALAAAHRDSIVSIGARFYDEAVVDEWAEGLAGDRYVRAMQLGETFFVAAGGSGGEPAVLGFSSHRVEDGDHRTAIYVRAAAARRGIGSALFRAAEAVAVAAGATTIHVAASLAAVEFYLANGFEVIEPGVHHLRSGRLMACVFMQKRLPPAG